jgi:hypothetical protein
MFARIFINQKEKEIIISTSKDIQMTNIELKEIYRVKIFIFL